MTRERVVRGLLLLAGLVFALLGQVYFFYRPEFWRDGLFFWGVSLLASFLLWRRMRARSRLGPGRSLSLGPWFSWLVAHPLRLVTALGGLLLSLAAGMTARATPPAGDFMPALLLWLAGIACFLLAFFSPFSPAAVWRRFLDRLHRRRGEWVGIVLLILVAFLVRFINLEHIPVNLSGDEGTWGNEGRAMLNGPLDNPFSTRWFEHPSLAFLLTGISMRVFGESVAGLRMLSVLTGTASVWATFLLARELWGRRVAWMAAVLLTFGHYHMHYSRLAFDNITDSLLITLALYLVVRGMRSRRALYLALAGTVMGFGWYEYFGSRLAIVLVLGYILWRGLVDYRFSRPFWRLLAPFLCAVLVVAVPLLIYYLGHSTSLNAGWHRVSIVSAEWFTREQEVTGMGPIALIWRQVWRSISGFHYTVDPTFHYRASIPLLDLVSGALLIFGLVWTGARWRKPGNGLLFAWFWIVVIVGWVMTENPPSSQRLVVIAPALALLVGLGLDLLLRLGRRVLGTGPAFGWNGVAILMLVLIASLNVSYYFFDYTPTRVYGNPTAEIATRLGRYLRERADAGDGDKTVFFYGPTVMYWDFGTLRFLVPDVEGMDVYPPGQAEEPEFDNVQGARFVFLPHRLAELEPIKTRFPGGEERSVFSDSDGRLLYVLYEVER